MAGRDCHLLLAVVSFYFTQVLRSYWGTTAGQLLRHTLQVLNTTARCRTVRYLLYCTLDSRLSWSWDLHSLVDTHANAHAQKPAPAPAPAPTPTPSVPKLRRTQWPFLSQQS